MNKNMMVMCLSAHQLHARKATNLSSYPLELGCLCWMWKSKNQETHIISSEIWYNCIFPVCMYNITPHMLWAYCSCGFQWEASNFQEDKFCFLKSSQTSKRTTQAIWSSFFYVHHSQMKQERFPNSKMWCYLPPEMSLRPPSSGSNSMLLSSWLDTTTYWYQHLLSFPVKTVGNRICLWKQPLFFFRDLHKQCELCTNTDTLVRRYLREAGLQ